MAYTFKDSQKILINTALRSLQTRYTVGGRKPESVEERLIALESDNESLRGAVTNLMFILEREIDNQPDCK